MVLLMGLWEPLQGHRLGHLLSLAVLVLLLLCVVWVDWVLSFCSGGLKGLFDPLRVGFVLAVLRIPEFFVPADVISLSLLRESEVLGELCGVSFRGGFFVWEDLRVLCGCSGGALGRGVVRVLCSWKSCEWVVL